MRPRYGYCEGGKLGGRGRSCFLLPGEHWLLFSQPALLVTHAPCHPCPLQKQLPLSPRLSGNFPHTIFCGLDEGSERQRTWLCDVLTGKKREARGGPSDSQYMILFIDRILPWQSGKPTVVGTGCAKHGLPRLFIAPTEEGRRQKTAAQRLCPE